MSVFRPAAVIVALVSIAAVGCLDVEGGDRGVYGSPCGTTFHELLLCDRESGGADPQTSPGGPGEPTDRAATCQDACEILAACQGRDPSEVPQCTAGCQDDNPAQSLLDCIVDEGCNYPVCFGETP